MEFNAATNLHSAPSSWKIFYALNALRLVFYMTQYIRTKRTIVERIKWRAVTLRHIAYNRWDVKCGSDVLITSVPITDAIEMRIWSKQKRSHIKISRFFKIVLKTWLLSRMVVRRKPKGHKFMLFRLIKNLWKIFTIYSSFSDNLSRFYSLTIDKTST